MIIICAFKPFPFPMPWGPIPATDPSTHATCLVMFYRLATRAEYEASQHAQGQPIEPSANYFYEVSMD